MSSSKQKILVVDDEESLCEIIQFNLEVEGVPMQTLIVEAIEYNPYERYKYKNYIGELIKRQSVF